VFNYSGHGFLDLSSYDKYMDGKLEDYSHPGSEIEAALKDLPQVE
jgi:tryptophan synthase beta chain